MKRVLVVSPHPDDESIGCGGTIREHILQGDFVEVVFLTSGEAGGHGVPVAEAGLTRESEARAALAILGVQAAEFWKLPDGRLRASRKLAERVQIKCSDPAADYVYVPHGQESHPDHRVAYRIVVNAMRALRRQDIHPVVRTYEIWTPLSTMEHIVDITDHMETKLAAIRAHKSQCDVLPFDEAFRGLARYRGEMHSWPGGPYAEVFGSITPKGGQCFFRGNTHLSSSSDP